MNVIVPPLPYAMDALEPHLSRRTLAAHYGRHHVVDVEKTRRLIETTPLQAASIESIVRARSEIIKPALRSAAAHAWNHAFYWSSMDPAGGGDVDGLLAKCVEASFGSEAAFRHAFVAAACELVGSGWIWIVLDAGRVRIIATANADTPLVTSYEPLLAIDLWEHAYYLDYQHRRADYVDAFLRHLANWSFANRNLAAALDRTKREGSRWNAVARAAATDIPLRGTGGR
jgi:Fe-Mn family superoxide dismutase